MKKYIKAYLPVTILIFAFCVWPVSEHNETKAQMVVADPIAQTQLSTQITMQASMDATLLTMEKTQKIIEKVKESTEFIQDLKTIYEISRLIGDLVCTFHDLRLLMNKNGLMQICHVRAHYQLAMLDIQAASDFLMLILKGGLKMDQGVRMQNLKEVITLMRSGHTKLLLLTNTLKISSSRTKMTKAYNQSMYATMSIYKF